MELRASDPSAVADGMAHVNAREERIASPARQPPVWSLRRRRRAAGAIVLALAIAGLAYIYLQRTTTYIATGTRTRDVTLLGAATMTVYGGSRVDIERARARIDIRIADGGASFKVPSDLHRRITVRVPGGSIQPTRSAEAPRKATPRSSETAERDADGALDVKDGIEFNVLRKGALTGVFVSEGTVRIRGDHQEEPVIVEAGEATNLSAQGVAAPAARVEDDRLQFDSPLGQVADIFNAHNTVPQLRVIGEAATRRIGGLVHIHKPENLSLALNELGDYTLETRGNFVTIRLKNPQ
jgi:ferric-dicitrate binding protein FerR (iron transport regulator)